MFYSASFYLCFVVFLLGLTYRTWRWFTLRVGPEAEAIPAHHRVRAAVGGVLATLCSARILTVFKVLFLDVLLQIRTLRQDPFRWVMHLCLYWGFTALLLMHALDEPLTQAFFPAYAPTLNPFLFLRNLFGAAVLLGLAMAIYRRAASRPRPLMTRAADKLAILLLALILISGFSLEALKILSADIYDRMVEDYAGLDPEESRPLKRYWAAKFGVAFAGLHENPSPETLDPGREMHEENCAACHSRPGWAFVSYPLSRALRPWALAPAGAHLHRWLWTVHFLACFLGLAYLPFSKFFHLFSSPLSLIVNGVSDAFRSGAANRVTRRALGLDACTHCGTCSLHCSVAPVFRILPNEYILPSEKLIALKALARGRPLSGPRLGAIQEGSFICTNCYRCTTVCPVGINLQDLWLSSKEELTAMGLPELHAWTREMDRQAWAQGSGDDARALMPGDRTLPTRLALSDQAATFRNCFQCQTCTNVCPVVANDEDPAESLDLTPHQIMYALGLGLKERMLGSRMVWDCVTCYLCQEHCPQGVRVTDVLYELKNLSYARARAAGSPRAPAAQDRDPGTAGSGEVRP